MNKNIRLHFFHTLAINFYSFFQVLQDDINTALPFTTGTYKVSMSGKKLMEVLEHSVEDRIDSTRVKHGGRFLQFSGVQVVNRKI